MAIDPLIARGGVPLDVTSTLAAIAEMRARDEHRNALIAQQQRELSYQQQQDVLKQQQADAQDQAWSEGFAAFQGAKDDTERLQHLGALSRIDPQAAALIGRSWAEQKTASEPTNYASQRVGGFEVLTQGGKHLGHRAIPVIGGGGSGTSGGGGGRSSVSQQGSEQYTILPPEAVSGMGLPAETLVQLNNKNGKLDILSKAPEQPFSTKDLSAARLKLIQIKSARNQLELVKNKYAALKDTFSAGAGGAFLPTQEGKAADAAVNSMKDMFTTITRTPGIGAMSDYETRLAQLKFPDRNQYESVSAQQIQSIEQLLNDLESGYREILGGSSAVSTQPSPTMPSASVPKATPSSTGWGVVRQPR